MKLRLTKSFEAEYRKITRGNFQLQRKIKKQLVRLRQDLTHPSLRLHKLQSSPWWSASVDKSVRIFLIIDTDGIYVYHIGKHEDVY